MPGNVKAVEDEICKKLEKALTTGNFMYKRTSDVNDRKVYRMVSTKKYVIGKNFHPVLGKEVMYFVQCMKIRIKAYCTVNCVKKGDVDNVIEWFITIINGKMLEIWIKE